MLRLREMRSVLEKAKTQGVSMQRRLVLYWFSMALAILAAVLLVVSLTGVFSNTAQKFGQSLTIQKHNTTSALAGQMDQLTAQSIALSEELMLYIDLFRRCGRLDEIAAPRAEDTARCTT